MAARVHLVKLCVGVETPAELARLLKRRRGVIFHDTRAFPRRSEEILNGGSLYWVFRGFIRARQPIKELKPMKAEDSTKDNAKKCRIIFDRKLYLTRPQPRRAFQGWRYLEEEDAPPDLSAHDKAFADMPDDMREELTSLGMFSRYE